jgi:hypothetical protein
MLASEDTGDLRGSAAENFILEIDDIPIPGNIRLGDDLRVHQNLSILSSIAYRPGKA